MSYYSCVELQGPEDQLLATLSKLTSKEAGEYCFRIRPPSTKQKPQGQIIASVSRWYEVDGPKPDVIVFNEGTTVNGVAARR